MLKKPIALPICVLSCVHAHVETQTSVSGGPTSRTPVFSVRRRTGLPRVEGERRAASFQLPSPSLSSKKAPSSRPPGRLPTPRTALQAPPPSLRPPLVVDGARLRAAPAAGCARCRCLVLLRPPMLSSPCNLMNIGCLLHNRCVYECRMVALQVEVYTQCG